MDVSINNKNNDKSPDAKGDIGTTISSTETKNVTKDKEQSINSPVDAKENSTGMKLEKQGDEYSAVCVSFEVELTSEI